MSTLLLVWKHYLPGAVGTEWMFLRTPVYGKPEGNLGSVGLLSKISHFHPGRSRKGIGMNLACCPLTQLFEPKIEIRKNEGLMKVPRPRISSDSRLKNESKLQIPAMLLWTD